MLSKGTLISNKNIKSLNAICKSDFHFSDSDKSCQLYCKFYADSENRIKKAKLKTATNENMTLWKLVLYCIL